MAARGGRGGGRGGRGGRRGPGGLEAENKFQVSYDPRPVYPVSQNINTTFVICFYLFLKLLHESSIVPPFLRHNFSFASYFHHGKGTGEQREDPESQVTKG
jgi:hypothetical protein